MNDLARTVFVITIFGLLFTACQINNPPEASPQPSSTSRPTRTPTLEPTITLTPTATSTSVPTSLAEPLFDWPPPQLTEEQISAGRDCPANELYRQRYQDLDERDPASLLAAAQPQNDCDWVLYASLVANYLTEEEFLARDDWNILQNAIYQNPGLILTSPGTFFTANYYLEIVAPPPFTDQPLTQIDIDYQWGGMGSSVMFDLSIQIGEQAWASGTATYGAEWDEAEDAADTVIEVDQEVMHDIVEAMGTSLDNLIPVDAQGEFFMCFDNYPDWEITLTYADGTTVVLATNGSNIYDMGGPFQTEIDGQNYVLGSISFYQAVWYLVGDLDLSLGSPMAMSCFGENYVDVVFPQQ